MRMGPEIIGDWYAGLSLRARVVLFVNLIALGLLTFTAIASWVLLWKTGLLPLFPGLDRFRQFWVYLPYFHVNRAVHTGITMGAIAGALPFVMLGSAVWNARKLAKASRPLYGETAAATPDEMKTGGLKLDRRL